jgi:hypothetical protein
VAVPKPFDFIAQAVRRRLAERRYRAWQRDFRQLQRDVRAAGGFGLGETKEEVIVNLREIRQQIFEEEYAHLYGVGPDDRG